MKNNKDSTLEIIAFILIALIDVGLSYKASLVLPDVHNTAVWERIITAPMMSTIYIFAPDLGPGYVIIGWIGSLAVYFAIGLAILLLIQYLVKKHGGKGGGPRI
ncbi:MAG: hypothetical protein LV481_05275 [Methylacidiphilales bacterium]|nr:hypothetical protein [Candidatus Methylacidiphilales bacterium]